MTAKRTARGSDRSYSPGQARRVREARAAQAINAAPPSGARAATPAACLDHHPREHKIASRPRRAALPASSGRGEAGRCKPTLKAPRPGAPEWQHRTTPRASSCCGACAPRPYALQARPARGSVGPSSSSFFKYDTSSSRLLAVPVPGASAPVPCALVGRVTGTRGALTHFCRSRPEGLLGLLSLTSSQRAH